MPKTKASRRILNLCAESSALLVTIPDEKNNLKDPPDDFVFNRVNIEPDATSSSADKQVHVTVKKTIHESDHSTVYLGDIEGQRVVLKCCYNMEYYNDFYVEARVYKKRLEELQGRVVPVFFGYYLAVDEEYGPYSLLLLEYCGRSLKTIFQDLEAVERYVVMIVPQCTFVTYYSKYYSKRVKILNLLGEFHNKGRLHLTDFAERNVVERNGKYRLIDFHDFIGHSCDWSKNIDWQIGEFWLVAQSHLPCDILAHLGDQLRIWNDCKFKYVLISEHLITCCSQDSRPIVKIHGRIFPASDFPPQDVIDKLMPRNFIIAPRNWEWADAYLKEIKKEMDENPNFNLSDKLENPSKPPLSSNEWRGFS